MKLHERIIGIESKADHVEFVRALAADLGEHGPSWENPTLDVYLSALASWLEDSDGYYRNQGCPIPPNPSWRDVAEMLMAARMHE